MENKDQKRIFIKNSVDKIGKRVKLSGWVDSVRSHGKIIFLDLRDKTGILQLFFSQENKELLDLVKSVKPEWVIEVVGAINKRPAKMINPKIETGDIEMKVENMNILSQAKELPFPIGTDGYKINETKRLKYRYLDLRRARLKKNLEIRHDVMRVIRRFLQEREFVEVETPILTKSTPEGARDFVVPSRLQPGKFYALPQSPQQYKQLLMVAGIERYFQIARCFRDEDPRADRAYGEFTQLDIEMSFVNQQDILELTEKLFIEIIKEIFPNKKIQQYPFPRITYEEAMKKYGTDKPDIRKNKNDKNELAFCYIIDWPLFEKTETKEISSSHHPFTAPKNVDIPLLDKEPMKVRSWQHDLVLNGFEVGGGSIRITDPQVQKQIFKILGHTEEEIKQKFGHLLEAFEYGVPPHGGIAPGIDRFLMVVLGEPNIREVMAFPCIASGKTAVMNAPSELRQKQLNELHLKIKKGK